MVVVVVDVNPYLECVALGATHVLLIATRKGRFQNGAVALAMVAVLFSPNCTLATPRHRVAVTLALRTT